MTAAAKWLYWMYGTNQSEITGGGFTYHDTSADRTALQEAIWQGVLTLASPGHPSHSLGLPRPGQTTGGTEPMTTEAWAWYDTAVAAVASNPEFLNYVYVVNPGPAPDGYYGFGEAQSMLYAHTPEPASIIVWSLIATVSYLGVTIWRRRARV